MKSLSLNPFFILRVFYAMTFFSILSIYAEEAKPAPPAAAATPAEGSATDTNQAVQPTAAPTPAAEPVPAPAEPQKEKPKYIRFRAGKILAAELTKKKLPVKNVSKFDPLPNQPPPKKGAEESLVGASAENMACAVVAVKLDKGRSIGVFDYVLTDGGADYRCYAISEEDTPFDASKLEYPTTSSKKIYKLLFIVELPIVLEGDIKYSMRFNLLPANAKEIPILFTNKGNGDVTPAKDIPKEGTFGPKEEPVVAPVVPKATPAPEATPAAAPAAKPAAPAAKPAAPAAKPAAPAKKPAASAKK